MTSNLEGRDLPEDVQDTYFDDLENSCDEESMHSCNSGDCQADKVDSTAQKVSGDVVDLLPPDPFGMGFNAAAFTGWFEDFSMKNLDFESIEAGEEENTDHHVVAELNIVWKGSALFHYDTPKTKSSSGFDDCFMKDCYYEKLDELMCFVGDKYWSPPDEYCKPTECLEDNIGVELGPPPDALFYVLGYLGVKDLLSAERVCKSLRDAVQTDPLLWRNIRIDHPLSGKITNDALVHLAQRAQGSLNSLSLIGCRDITDVGLKRVLETNTKLTQLDVRGCLALSIQCVIAHMKLFKSIGRPGINCLRTGGLFAVSLEDIEELKLTYGDENERLPGSMKPRFSHWGNFLISYDDDRYIDIEPCPSCNRVIQVYDCPADGCRGKWDTPQACRACSLCINRCINCGRCLSNLDYEETFCLDLICLDCMKEIVNCEDHFSPLCQSTVLVVHLQQ